jgi:nucleotide-binding universal stress UspA family protein
MHVILGIITDSPYRTSIAKFADRFADVLGGRVRLATLGQRCSGAAEVCLPETPEDEEALLKRAEAEAEEAFRDDDQGPKTPVESVWLGGQPIEECVREMARCDFGVVGKALQGEPQGGRGIGPEVEELKQSVTKPIVIVPREVRPIRKALFVYTEHPEAGHALRLAVPLSQRGVAIRLVTAIEPLGRTELIGSGAAYLEQHEVPFESVDLDCEGCQATGGPAGEVLHAARQEDVDLIVMGGTRRGILGRIIWPEMAHEVVWNANVPVLIWY